MIVTEIRQWSVKADTKEEALSKRKSGEGELVSSQDVVNGSISYNGKQRTLLDPIPTEQWPLWAKALRQFSTEDDAGIGDVVARIIGDENSEAFKAWHLKTFGKPCNCTARRNRWNKLYPLK